MTSPDRDSQADLELANDPVDLARKAADYGLELVVDVAADMLDPALVKDIPVAWARANAVLPVRIGEHICALTADPSQISQCEYISVLLSHEVRPVLASRDVILRAIESCYFQKSDTAEDFIRDLDDDETGPLSAPRGGDLLEVATDAPITQLVNLILLEAVKARASDIHVEPFEDSIKVRYRVDGYLHEHSSPPKHLQAALVSRIKVMGQMDISEKRLPQDGVARVRVGEREIDVRVSTVPVAQGERIVLRLLDRDSTVVSLEKLGMSGNMFEQFRELVAQSNGIILVTGPTGSGKTTTLYAALRGLDAAHRNIMTIEDPIEYQLPEIGQINVRPKIGLTFSEGLRHVLRQDPDVILVGETRDYETAEIAVKASLTGHLVFSTLHTNDAPSAIIRLIDMGVEPYLLATSLRGIVAQRLVRRLCTSCRCVGRLDERELAALGDAGRELRGERLWQARGCAECRDGYRGRVGLFELMRIKAELQACVRDGANNLEELRQIGARAGLRSLIEDGVDKIKEGVTSASEVVRVLGQVA